MNAFKSPSGREKRSDPRLALSACIQYRIQDREDLTEGELNDISLSGFSFWTAEELAVNSDLELWITLSDAKESPIRICATVRWVHTEPEDHWRLYGCRVNTMINTGNWFDLIYALKQQPRRSSRQTSPSGHP